MDGRPETSLSAEYTRFTTTSHFPLEDKVLFRRVSLELVAAKKLPIKSEMIELLKVGG